MKGKYLAVSVGAVLTVVVCVTCVVLLLHRRDDVYVESFAEQTEVVTVEQTRPEALLDESEESEVKVSPAEFDWSGYEYWQQNVLNTIAKTISNCADDENVKILNVEVDGDVGHIVVEKNDIIYEADFDTKSYAILNEY